MYVESLHVYLYGSIMLGACGKMILPYIKKSTMFDNRFPYILYNCHKRARPAGPAWAQTEKAQPVRHGLPRARAWSSLALCSCLGLDPNLKWRRGHGLLQQPAQASTTVDPLHPPPPLSLAVGCYRCGEVYIIALWRLLHRHSKP